MPKDTPSMAKNKIRRSLMAILDPHPTATEVNKLWQFFDSSCAYCGFPIERESRTGHLDHLIPSTSGGGNSIYNHALSCARCNGDEKREEAWESFLAKKSESKAQFLGRKAKIEEWLSFAPASNISEERLKQAEAIINDANQRFESSIQKMRELKSSDT